MIILEQRKNKNSPNPYIYIAGIFVDIEKYTNYINDYPEPLKSDLKEIHREGSFPLFIIEGENGFEYIHDKNSLRERFNSIEKVDDEDYIYFNLYIIKEEYIPHQVGRDEMGSLKHFHIQNDDLESYSQKGLSYFRI